MTHYFVSDVCETLVEDNTTLGLLQRHFRRTSRMRSLLLKCGSETWSPLWFGLVLLERILKRPVLSRFQVLLLRGQRYSELVNSARTYASELLANKRVSAVFAQLEEPMKEHRLILASAGLTAIVGELARVLNVEFVASTLETAEGVLTGRYESDNTGRKLEALDARFGKSWRADGYDAISDNFTDMELLRSAVTAFVVIRSEDAKVKWKGLNAIFVKVQK